MLTENFDSYSNGDLNGQGSWSGSTLYQVQSTTVQGGSKAISFNSSTGSPTIAKTFTGTADDNQVFYLRFASLNGNTERFGISVRTGTTKITDVCFVNRSGSVNLEIMAAANTTVATGLSADTWYKIEVEWKNSDDTVRCRINDGTWSSYVAASNAFSTADKIQFVAELDNPQLVYWDTFTSASTAWTQTLTETLTHTDSIIRAITRNLSETITHTDSIIRSIVRTLSDTITHTDVFAGVRVQIKELLETLSHTDSVIKSTVRTLTDTITHTDTIVKTANKILSETLTITDTFVRGFVKVLTETLTFSSYLLGNGVLIVSNLWSYVSKNVASWIHRNKS